LFSGYEGTVSEPASLTGPQEVCGSASRYWNGHLDRAGSDAEDGVCLIIEIVDDLTGLMDPPPAIGSDPVRQSAWLIREPIRFAEGLKCSGYIGCLLVQIHQTS
jgi:hypothetical protein